MKTPTIYDLRFTILATALIALSTLNSLASLTAIVTPAYQFPLDGSVMPTYALLNQLATPTIQILGSVGGSNTLSPGSVTGASMSDGFVDGVTIGYNTASPRAIQVKRQGISTNEFNTNDWYWPLVQGAVFQQVQLKFDPTCLGTNSSGLTFFYDTNFFTTNTLGLTKGGPTNTVSIIQTNGAATNVFVTGRMTIINDTNIFNGRTNIGPTLSLNYFMSGLSAVPTFGNKIDTAHGLGRTPAFMRSVLVCQTAEFGYTVGDEVDMMSVPNASGNAVTFSVGANTTNVFLVRYNSGANLVVFDKTSGNNSVITPGNWRVKFYAW